MRERNGWNGGLTDELVGPTRQYYTYTGIIPRTDSNLNRCADRQPKVTFQNNKRTNQANITSWPDYAPHKTNVYSDASSVYEGHRT